MKKLLLPAFILFFALANAQGYWKQKKSIIQKAYAVGFSIGTKGFIGTGAGAGSAKDLWEWDKTSNTWTQKADCGGGERTEAIGFSIGTKGYIGTGLDGNGQNSKEFWEWDQITNVWTQKSDFAGEGRVGAVGFSIGNKGYIGVGGETIT